MVRSITKLGVDIGQHQLGNRASTAKPSRPRLQRLAHKQIHRDARPPDNGLPQHDFGIEFDSVVLRPHTAAAIVQCIQDGSALFNAVCGYQ